MRLDYGLAIRIAYASCLSGATFNHVGLLIQHGLFWDYGGVPWPSAAVWTLLTVLDPTAALLLFLRPRTGLIMTAAIIAADVAHNSWISFWYFPLGLTLQHPEILTPLGEQAMFLLFVACTIGIPWARLKKPNRVP